MAPYQTCLSVMLSLLSEDQMFTYSCPGGISEPRRWRNRKQDLACLKFSVKGHIRTFYWYTVDIISNLEWGVVVLLNLCYNGLVNQQSYDPGGLWRRGLMPQQSCDPGVLCVSGYQYMTLGHKEFQDVKNIKKMVLDTILLGTYNIPIRSWENFGRISFFQLLSNNTNENFLFGLQDFEFTNLYGLLSWKPTFWFVSVLWGY